MKDNTPSPSIDEYIAGFPPQIQELLQRIRATIRENAPLAQEAISYGMPTFKLHGNLVHFAAHTHHIGFYPAPSGIDNFRQELARYKTSKGALQFPFERPIPFDLIAAIVRFRVGENMKQAEMKRKRK